MTVDRDDCMPDADGVGEISEQTLIAEVQARMIGAYPHVSADEVAALVQRALGRFENSLIRDFVPLLVERRARAELANGAQLALATQ